MLKGIGVAIVLLALGLMGFSYSGIYDVSARIPHHGAIEWLLSTTSHQSVKQRAQEVVIPDLTNEELVLIGSGDFDAMCVGCHGAPGKEKSAMGKGLNPAAPDLVHSAAHMSAAELFWVTSNGIRMTGMPAWGVSHSDAELWPVVAFLLKLPGLTEVEYGELVAMGREMSHHAASAHTPGGDAPNPSLPDENSTEASETHTHDAHDHEH